MSVRLTTEASHPFHFRTENGEKLTVIERTAAIERTVPRSERSIKRFIIFMPSLVKSWTGREVGAEGCGTLSI